MCHYREFQSKWQGNYCSANIEGGFRDVHEFFLSLIIMLYNKVDVDKRNEDQIKDPEKMIHPLKKKLRNMLKKEN